MMLLAGKTVSAQISGGENKIVPMALIVDGRGVGTIDATIAGDSILLDRSRLRAVLEHLIDEQLFNLFALNSAVLASLDELNALGIATEYDSALLETRIELPVELRNVQALNLSSKMLTGSAILSRPANFSAYLNLNLLVELQSELIGSPDAYSSLSFRLGVQPVLNLHGWVLDAGAGFDSGAATEFNLEYARIVKDFPRRLLRLTIGSLFSPVTGYLSSLSYAGVELVHDPEMTRRQHSARYAGKEFIIDKPSLVSVLLNGQVQRNFNLEPGRYQVKGYSFISGLNQVLFNIKDQDGSSYSLHEVVPFDSRILEPSEMSFSASLGIPQWEIAQPVFTGYFLQGFFPGISGGGSLQIGLDRQMGGLEATVATRMGNFRGMAGISLHELMEPDFAGLLEYRLAFGAGKMRPAFFLRAQYLGEGFLGPNSETGSNPYAWQFNAAANQPLPFGFGINVGAGYRIGRNQTANETTATFSLLKLAGTSVVLSFLFGANLLEGAPASFQATFGLTASDRSGRRTLNLNSDVVNKSSALNFRIQPGTSLGGPILFGSLSGISPIDTAQLVGSVGMQYLNPFFDMTLQDFVSAGQNRFSFAAGFALVAAGGGRRYFAACGRQFRACHSRAQHERPKNCGQPNPGRSSRCSGEGVDWYASLPYLL